MHSEGGGGGGGGGLRLTLTKGSGTTQRAGVQDLERTRHTRESGALNPSDVDIGTQK